MSRTAAEATTPREGTTDLGGDRKAWETRRAAGGGQQAEVWGCCAGMGTGPAGPPASTGKGVRGQRGSPKRRRRGQRPRRETVARTVPSLGTGLDIGIRDAHRLPSYLNAKRPSRDVTLKLPGAGDGALGWGGHTPQPSGLSSASSADTLQLRRRCPAKLPFGRGEGRLSQTDGSGGGGRGARVTRNAERGSSPDDRKTEVHGALR